MLDLYLRFADESAAAAVLAAIGIARTEGVWPCDGVATDGTGFSLDLLFGTGTIYRKTGETIESGHDPVPMVDACAGYHINMIWRAPNPPATLEPYLMTPSSPAVVWAMVGGPT